MKTTAGPPPLPAPISAPGPELLDLLRSLTGLRDNPLTFLQAAAERYGELVHFQIGPLHAFVLSRPADIQYVLLDNHRNYSKDTLQYNALARVTGRGLLTSDGETWLSQRRRMQPAFHRQRILGFGPLMASAAARQADRWKSASASGALIDLDRDMMELTLEILGQALLGVNLRREAPALTSAVLVALDSIVQGIKSPDLLPAFIPTPGRLRFKKAMRTLDQAVAEIIQSHRRSSSHSDLLATMLQTAEGGDAMTDQQLRDELITILIAGHETVASALTWACYLLAQNPLAEERLHQELEQVLNGRAPTLEDLPALAYTRRVFDEALRLYPPAWLVTRKNLKEDRISGVRIPPGSLVVISIAGVQRSPAYWPEPDRFEPDRFLPENSTARPRFAYLPFGGGPRLCIGNHFALAEAPLILASLYQHYHLELDPLQEVVVDALVTLRPRGGLRMRLHTRPVKSGEEASL